MTTTRRRLAVSMLCATAAVLIAASADAQTQVSTWTPIQEGPAITLAIGGAFNNPLQAAGPGNILSRTNSSLDLSTRIDTPVHEKFLVRFEAGKAAWRFTGEEYQQEPSFSLWSKPPVGELVTDRVAIRRMTLSMIRRHLHTPSGWAPLYVGGGVGAYRFRSLQRGRRYSQPWQIGIHGLAGIECPLPNTRFAIAAEAQMHMPGVPWDSVVNRNWFTILDLSLAMKIRM